MTVPEPGDCRGPGHQAGRAPAVIAGQQLVRPAAAHPPRAFASEATGRADLLSGRCANGHVQPLREAPNQRKETIVKQLLTIIRCWLKRSQYRTDLIDGFLAHTGLSLEPGST